MKEKNSTPTRREVTAAATALFTTNLFTGNVKGANDKIAIGFIGLGAMGSGNLGHAMKVPELQPVALCDVYEPHLERAVAAAKKGGYAIEGKRDFRQVLADKSIDAVCISTPDHWHAYMMIEACKAGKDVYVEKPASVYVEEGQKMVQAARKYKRIVQAGTMQRSGGFFLKAQEIVKSGVLGEVTFVHAFQSGMTEKKGFVPKPDDNGKQPTDLNWDMWLGPAPKADFDPVKWGVKVTGFPSFRYFWDYAGGAMTDWGVHLIDPLHQCFDEVMPTSIVALGEKFYVTDTRDTPDTMLATFQYPKFLSSYESRTANPLPAFGLNQGAGTLIHGSQASLLVNRSGCWLIPNNPKSDVVKAETWDRQSHPEMAPTNLPHWQNWVACIKSREAPRSEIETCVRSSTTCILANLSMRFKTRLDWDEKNWTVKQKEVVPHLKPKYRAPWKLEV